MSASAENLNVENNSTINLVTLVDKSFHPKHKSDTAPTSHFASPKYKGKPYTQSMTLNTSENNNKLEDHVHLNHFSSDECNINNSQDIEIIFEENNSISEVLNNYITNNDVEMQQSFTSTVYNSPQRSIYKQSLKRSYSFNDLNIKQISKLNKKHGSIQTFISTNATLSVEFESKTDQLCNQLTPEILKNLNYNSMANSYNNLMKLIRNPNSNNEQVTMDDNYDKNLEQNLDNKVLKISKYQGFKGDDTSEINELQIEKYELNQDPYEEDEKDSNKNEYQIEVLKSKETYFEKFEKFVTHPLFVTGIVITGFIIMMPTINKFSAWITTTFVNQPIKSTLPSLKPLGPKFLMTHKLPSFEELERDHLYRDNYSSLKLFIPYIVQEQFKRINSFIPNGFRKF